MFSFFFSVVYFSGGLVVSYLILDSIRKFIRTFNLFAPSKLRDLHSKPIPSFIGVGFIVLFLLGTFFYSKLIDVHIDYSVFLLCLLIITLIGVRDDLLEISSKEKLLFQLIAINILLYANQHLVIDHLHGFLGIYEIPFYFGYFFTCFIGVAVINSFNLIDGIDGNAGVNALISFVLFAVIFWTIENQAFLGICILMSSLVLGYLFINLRRVKKGFMGDTGSLFLGFMIFVMTLLLMNSESVFLANILPSKSVLPLAPLSIFILPILDTLSVYSYRIKIGRSPFSPDNYHLHHLALKLFSRHHFTAALFLNGFVISFCLLFALLSFNTPPLISISLYFAFVFLLVVYSNRIRTTIRRRLGKKASDVVVFED